MSPPTGGAAALREAFAQFDAQLIERPLADFSRLAPGVAPCCSVAPPDPAAAAAVLGHAARLGVPLRTRGQGHSLNGCSLPRDGELLLSTHNLRQVRFEAEGTVTAGSGVVLWVLQHILRRHGFDLPVLNDGYPGPSVGGFLAAGGFGPRSGEHGGYWDNVVEVLLVDGGGRTRRVTRDEALFPWLFGAMGQLGVVLEARLSIVPLDAARAPPYPEGLALTAAALARPQVPPEYAAAENERLFWFTLLAPDERLMAALADLAALERRHAGALRFQERYRYPIRHRGRVAPLVYPEARNITATGAWGWLGDASPQGVAALREFDRDFMEVAQARPWARRYVQSELATGPALYARCFGTGYQKFSELKRELDPRHLLNRGSVFLAT